MQDNQRLSGILLHPTSFPSPYGIGDLGSSAYQFIDFLKDAGQHLWQILPLTHTGYGDSPYQSFSAYAGQPLLISPSYLKELGLLSDADLNSPPVTDPEHIDYGTVIPWKQKIYETAFKNFSSADTGKTDGGIDLLERFENFTKAHAFWIYDYALFMACKDEHDGKSWLLWEDEYRNPTPAFKDELHSRLKDRVRFYQFLQFIFFEEWNQLKAYANQRGIQIIGDIPIFVSMDSADVWANQRLFQLDSKGYPLKVAGVPPDYFSATGQLWGNPLYAWDVHKQEGFSWWISRIRHQLSILDILRIDHFRGFEAYWAVPYGEETAVHGEWVKAPGYDLFYAIQHAFGEDLPIIAEDLGVITAEVDALRETFHFPGMKVLQFAFDSTSENAYLPHCYPSPGCVCYTGTHDNDTTLGWYQTLAPHCRQKVLDYTCCPDESLISHSLIRASLASIARYAVFPLQDVLSLGSSARMNTPGTASGNWGFRYLDGALTNELAEKLKKMTLLYGR